MSANGAVSTLMAHSALTTSLRSDRTLNRSRASSGGSKQLQAARPSLDGAENPHPGPASPRPNRGSWLTISIPRMESRMAVISCLAEDIFTVVANHGQPRTAHRVNHTALLSSYHITFWFLVARLHSLACRTLPHTDSIAWGSSFSS